MELTVKIEGTAPLLMHNNKEMTDPLAPRNKAMKAIGGKRTKTEDDHLQIARMEYDMGLYIDDELGPYVPGENFERCLREAGKITRMGTAIQRAVLVTEDRLPLLYRGPREVDAMFQAGMYDRRPVKVSTSTVIRTRPQFDGWSLEVPLVLDETILDPDEFEDIADKAGRLIGLCDYRPRFGRFEVTGIE